MTIVRGKAMHDLEVVIGEADPSKVNPVRRVKSQTAVDDFAQSFDINDGYDSAMFGPRTKTRLI